ncbi:MAG: phosphatidylserine decarboxylase [Christensenellales bacterium]
MLNALYNSRPGEYVLKWITRPEFSRKCAGFLDSGYSRLYIKRFIHKNEIDMSDYECERWRSFNDFFIRKIRPEARPIDPSPQALISPCDGFLSAYPIEPNSAFRVKGARYTVSTLLQSRRLAQAYAGGICLVFRMMPINYHRYIYPDDGVKGGNRAIQGKLHTVRPVAQGKYNVYITNSREYTILRTRNFGEVVFMEVGALMVGRICNHHQKHAFRRGEEKGYFEYGGSTIILLFRRGAAQLDARCAAALCGTEIPVRLGERIGMRADG